MYHLDQLVLLLEDFNTSGVNAGNVFKVNHFNHGMYSTTNKVKIKGIESDVAQLLWLQYYLKLKQIQLV